MRGAGILLVFLFSFWYWLYPQVPVPDIILHNVPGELHIGDFVFALFIFCSGISLWFFCIHAKSKHVPFDEAAGRYLRLLLLSVLISAMRLFIPFPDEVLVIALSALILLPLLWFNRLALNALYAGIALAMLMGLHAFAPLLWASLTAPYLGGVMAVLYYSLLVLAASQIAAHAFPLGKMDVKSVSSLWRSWVISLGALVPALLLGGPDKIGLSPSFLVLSLVVFIPLFIICIRIFDSERMQIPLVGRIGRSSLAGWAVFYMVSALFMYRNWGGLLDEGIYLYFCFVLFVALGVMLLALDFVRVRISGQKTSSFVSS